MTKIDWMLDRVPTHVMPYVALVWGFICGLLTGVGIN